MKHPTFFVKLLCLALIISLLFGYQRVAVDRAARVAEREEEIAQAEARNREVLRLMENTPALYTPGTYTGSAQGFGAMVTVSVTVDESEITAIDVTSRSGEDAAYFAQAETLIPAILRSQSTELDAVTGATLSSIGLLDAVDAALEQAVN